MRRAALGTLFVAVAALGGCGLKGALYLPEKPDVTVRPGPAATAPATPAESPVPETPPTPEQPPKDPPTGKDSG